MLRRRPRLDPVIAAMLAAVASESLPYTDPRAGYPTARVYRAARQSVALQAKGTPMAVSRNWDRSPETESDRRFHDLRASGYTGPVDQDGFAVTDPETLSIFDALDRATQRQMATRDTAEAHPDPAVQAIRQAVTRPATGEPSPYDPRKPRLHANRRDDAAGRELAADEW